MKKKILLACTLISIVLITTSSINDTQDLCDSPLVGGHTGAPASPACDNCHEYAANTGTGVVDFNLGGGVSEYIEGQTYDCSVTVTEGSFTKYGFCVTARKSSNASTGDFVLLDTVNTRKFTETGKKYFSHTPCGADAIIPGSRTWNFQWTAPSTNDGVITFYLSSLASNHDENTTGDWTYTLTKTLDVATSIQQVNDESVIQLYPNPAQEGIMISLNEEWKNAIITLHGVDGKKYFTFSALPDQNKILISRSEWNLNKGIYLLSIQSGENFFTKKIIFL